MTSVKLNFDEVNLPICYEIIAELGRANGISMYIIRTHKRVKYGELWQTRVLKIGKMFEKWSADIDTKPYEMFKDETIVEICRLDF